MALCWLIIAITLSTEYILFSTLGILYRDVHGFSASYSGLAYLGMAFGSITAALILVDRDWRLYVEMPDQQVRRTHKIGMSPYGYDSGCAIGGDWAFFGTYGRRRRRRFGCCRSWGVLSLGFGLIAVQVKYQYNLLIPSFFIHMLVNLDLLPTLPGRLL